jgi:prepilin-type N-terminal cleavage/methylation domain-containing protein
MAKHVSRPTRRAFTLVEMLTVIIIIGLLASLMLVAFGRARTNVRNSTVKADIKQIEMALERYRTEYGDYPPDFVGTADSYPDAVRIPARTAVIRHLRRRFPRLPIIGTSVDTQFSDLITAIRDASTDYNQDGTLGDGAPTSVTIQQPFNPSQALVFWLGGLPAFATSGELTGFSANPGNPFAPPTTASSRTTMFYEFQTGQLFKSVPDSPEPLSYGARDAAGVLQPYVYFRPVGNPYGSTTIGDPNFNWYLLALTIMQAPVSGYGFRSFSAGGTEWSQVPISHVSPVIPYVGPDGWANQAGSGSGGAVYTGTGQLIKPQIIWAGLDGDFGSTGVALDDNIANFTQGTTIRDDR